MAVPQSPATGNLLTRFYRWCLLRPYATLTLSVLAALVPFLAKPFNIDDPLFLWTAKQIHAHPLDPYGFSVNWYGVSLPMWQVTQNPPFACYYLAASAAVLGWSEVAMHTALLLPALAAILGTFRLARRYCQHPLAAAGLTLFTPVFLVSSTTVMCDTLLLAAWVWAVVFWLEGLKKNDLVRLIASGALIALAALTKYYGACLIPLLIAYALIQRRWTGAWWFCLLIPVATLAAYQSTTHALYGQGLLTQLSGYAIWAQQDFSASRPANTLITLAFTGGCLAGVTFLTPFLWRKWGLLLLLVGVAAVAGIIFLQGTIWKPYGSFAGSSRTLVEAQLIFWAIGGASLLALAGVDFQRERSAASALLGLWVIGTFIFTAFCNWTVNGRSLLPLAPAAAILVTRRLEQQFRLDRWWQIGATTGIVLGTALALVVTRADYQFANAARQNANAICEFYRDRPSTLWFEGHWGFQYYMEAGGGTALIVNQPVIQNADFLVIPGNNTNLQLPTEQQAVLQTHLNHAGPAWLSTCQLRVGAGFYTSMFGPLPFAFGHVPPETVAAYVPNTAKP